MTTRIDNAASSTQPNSVIDPSPTPQPSTPIGSDEVSDRTDSISADTNVPTSFSDSTSPVTFPSQIRELSTEILLTWSPLALLTSRTAIELVCATQLPQSSIDRRQLQCLVECMRRAAALPEQWHLPQQRQDLTGIRVLVSTGLRWHRLSV